MHRRHFVPQTRPFRNRNQRRGGCLIPLAAGRGLPALPGANVRKVARVTPCAPFVWRLALRMSHPTRGGQRTARPTWREAALFPVGRVTPCAPSGSLEANGGAHLPRRARARRAE
ncbi:MAG: hypothetical protein MUF81_12310 [Verrucomicrobia bacterium]|nr:hypothetical protein [Verrucomicrobiota bacterium]